jgi:hypothetical protein
LLFTNLHSRCLQTPRWHHHPNVGPSLQTRGFAPAWLGLVAESLARASFGEEHCRRALIGATTSVVASNTDPPRFINWRSLHRRSAQPLTFCVAQWTPLASLQSTPPADVTRRNRLHDSFRASLYPLGQDRDIAERFKNSNTFGPERLRSYLQTPRVLPAGRISYSSFSL